MRKYLKRVVENFPKMGKEMVTQVQETQRVANRISPRKNTPKTHINQINKDQTQKTHIKRSKRKATNNTQGDSLRITADLSIKTLQARKEWLLLSHFSCIRLCATPYIAAH